MIAHRGVERFRRESSTPTAYDDIGSARLQSNLPAFLKATRHPDQRHHGGDADGDSGESQAGANGTAQKTAHYDSEKSVVVARFLSETIRPSIMCSVRPARSAMDGSCVTRTPECGPWALLEPDNEVEDDMRVLAVEITGRFIG